MSIFAKIGRKHIEQAQRWVITSGPGFGAAAGVALCYFTEWKAVLQYVPYYNLKWSKEE